MTSTESGGNYEVVYKAALEGHHFDSRLSSLVNCNCYAKTLDPVVQFGMHFGAHGLDCPVFRPSRDAVDAKWDIEFRTKYQRVAACECESPHYQHQPCHTAE